MGNAERTTYHPAQVLLDGVLRRDIERLATEAVGKQVQIASYDVLTRPDALQVARITFNSEDQTALTAIVKHLRGDRYPIQSWTEAPPGFAEENFVYRFLSSLNPTFLDRPRVLGSTPGILLLEDLGLSTPNTAGAEDAVAHSLANLHVLTAQSYPQYCATRQAAGLQGDQRMYSDAECSSFFEIGKKLLVESCQDLGIPTNGVEQTLHDAQVEVRNPGTFHAFIHDDLAASRQIVFGEGRSWLIDFEMGKFGHALMDVSRPMVGKLTRKGGGPGFILKHQNFSPDFANKYRRHRTSARGVTCDDATWDHALSSSLIYTTFINSGALCCVEPHYQPIGGSGAIWKQMLERLIFLLAGNESHSTLKPVFSQIAAQIEA